MSNKFIGRDCEELNITDNTIENGDSLYNFVDGNSNITTTEVLNWFLHFHGKQLCTDEFMEFVAREAELEPERKTYLIDIEHNLTATHSIKVECTPDEIDSVTESIKEMFCNWKIFDHEIEEAVREELRCTSTDFVDIAVEEYENEVYDAYEEV